MCIAFPFSNQSIPLFVALFMLSISFYLFLHRLVNKNRHKKEREKIIQTERNGIVHAVINEISKNKHVCRLTTHRKPLSMFHFTQSLSLSPHSVIAAMQKAKRYTHTYTNTLNQPSKSGMEWYCVLAGVICALCVRII